MTMLPLRDQLTALLESDQETVIYSGVPAMVTYNTSTLGLDGGWLTLINELTAIIEPRYGRGISTGNYARWDGRLWEITGILTHRYTTHTHHIELTLTR